MKKLLDQLSLDDKRSMIEILVPFGRWEGNKYFAGSIEGGPGNSFDFNLDLGVGGDWADGKMDGLIGLWARVRNVEYAEAYKQIAQHYDLDFNFTKRESEPEIVETEEEHRERGLKVMRWQAARCYYHNLLIDRAGRAGEHERVSISNFRGLAGLGIKNQPWNYEISWEEIREQAKDPFDWSRCVFDYLTLVTTVAEDKFIFGPALLSSWRGYSLEFSEWMGERGLIGIHNYSVCFPVQEPEEGLVTRVHVFNHPESDGPKAYYSPGEKIYPLMFINPNIDPNLSGWKALWNLTHVYIAESQWDLFTLLYINGLWQRNQAYLAISTRGKNGVNGIDKVRIPPEAKVYVITQNDEANRQWLAELKNLLRLRHLFLVEPPPDHKDLNDWLRAKPELVTA
jgi:hypothetical protein